MVQSLKRLDKVKREKSTKSVLNVVHEGGTITVVVVVVLVVSLSCCNVVWPGVPLIIIVDIET